jgi:hypothetical protein
MPSQALRRMDTMAEPASTTAAGSGAFKLASALGLSVPLVAVLVMILTQPKSAREWAAWLISTVAGSIFGGAALVQYFELTSWLNDGPVGIAAIAGVIFAAGVPFWVIVRAFFKYAEMNRDKGLLDLIVAVRAVFKSKREEP